MPFTLVKSESFQELVLLRIPGQKVLSYPTLMAKVSAEYDLLKKDLKEELSFIDFVSMRKIHQNSIAAFHR
jgi:hypothetical protein